MDLVKLEKRLPLRAYIEADLNRILIMDFLPWLCSLLSLTDEVSANRLEMALPAIKSQCIGMGLHEIKKMFEMFADSKFSIKPIPNYFDRILLGKIISEYKSTKPKKQVEQPKKPTPAEIDRIMLDALDRCKKEVKEFGSIQGSAHHVYDWLESSKRHKFDNKYKKAAFSIAKRTLLSDAKNNAIGDYLLTKKLKETLSKIESGGNLRQVIIAKTILVNDYLK